MSPAPFQLKPFYQRQQALVPFCRVSHLLLEQRYGTRVAEAAPSTELVTHRYRARHIAN
jgi:hypothetical protein